MRFLILLALAIGFVGCGASKTTIIDKSHCEIEEVKEGVMIRCSDGKETFIRDGINGEHGRDGQDGVDGSDGKDGADGIDGEDGTSCSVSQTDQGAVITCGDSSAIVSNGQDGADGQNGTNGEDGQDGTDGADAVVELSFVEVCPDYKANTPHKEVLVRLDGVFMAFLADPKHQRQRLVTLYENETYQTTDTREALFEIQEGEIVCLN